LKIGILADLVPLVSCGEEELNAVLNKYVRSDGYLLACTEGAIRIDVNGDAAGMVSAKHAAHAQKVLAERELWRLKKKAARERKHTTRTADTERAAQRQPKRRPVTPKKGDGFASLKEAAARRCEVAGGR
jgi:ProP effector